MSRIEEALRIAAGNSYSPTAVEEPAPRAAQTTLTYFPREHRLDEEHPGADVAKRWASARGQAASEQPVSTDDGLQRKFGLRDATPVAIEQYRRLGGGLLELQSLHGVKTVMVTSAAPREGKSLSVANLAVTLSETYRFRVLLIDADLRRPSLHHIFKLSNDKGLSEGLRAEAGPLTVVQVSPRLSVLPAGLPASNPLAALTSERMRTVVAEAATAFDWVLLDAPPVGLMPDATLLVPLTHGVLFVIAAGITPHALVERAITEIGRENILGTILNQVEPDSIPAANYTEYY